MRLLADTAIAGLKVRKDKVDERWPAIRSW
jgi:hypothetical protein